MNGFALIKELNRKPKKDETGFEKMTKLDLQNFLDDLEIFYAKQKRSAKRNAVLKIINQSRTYMNASSVSIKMILDTLAMSI